MQLCVSKLDRWGEDLPNSHPNCREPNASLVNLISQVRMKVSQSDRAIVVAWPGSLLHEDPGLRRAYAGNSQVVGMCATPMSKIRCCCASITVVHDNRSLIQPVLRSRVHEVWIVATGITMLVTGYESDERHHVCKSVVGMLIGFDLICQSRPKYSKIMSNP